MSVIIKKVLLGLLVATAWVGPMQAHPLVISEVMSSSAGSSPTPDWWELTNLGTNSIDLTGYSWRDNSAPGFRGATNAQFAGVIIHPSESIIFSEVSGIGGPIATAVDFRNWWGISASVQVIMIGNNPGLSSVGDSVRLWSTNWAALGDNTNGLDLLNAPEYLVDQVDFPAATSGRTFYFNPNNGWFNAVSASGVSGAFPSMNAADIGSPGVASTNPAPLVIATQPANQLVNVGTPASFSVVAYGLPKPRFQWLFNGVPVNTNEVKAVFSVSTNYARSTLTLTNVQMTNAGTFRVVVANDYQSVVSSNATLTVSGDPLAPIFTQTPPTNLFAYPGQVVTLVAAAFGNPPPTFQWQFNGTNIDGQTDA